MSQFWRVRMARREIPSIFAHHWESTEWVSLAITLEKKSAERKQWNKLPPSKWISCTQPNRTRCKPLTCASQIRLHLELRTFTDCRVRLVHHLLCRGPQCCRAQHPTEKLDIHNVVRAIIIIQNNHCESIVHYVGTCLTSRRVFSRASHLSVSDTRLAIAF